MTITEDKIYYVIFNECDGSRKGLLEIDRKTGKTILHENWCEIILEPMPNEIQNENDEKFW